MTYGLGIDTGGTYTDSVIVELETGKVVCSSKALTTRDDLSMGIRGSLEGLDRSLLSEVSLTSLSSTLATNSVVEGKGCRVGLISIGKRYLETSLPEICAEIDGKFTMSGEEEIRLDAGAAKKALEGMRGKVDAVVISGYLSVRNPSHEERVAAMAARILGLPVVCGHELTSKLGYEVRTTTAVMNARLIPVIRELLDSVISVMKDLGIGSPLMVVKGDGAVMKADTALMRPVETILSGPASSLTGAKALAGTDDAVVIDIGGTTTDIGILNGGFPRIEPEGARIAGRRTRVMAADISTFGIGGDSRIVVNGKDIVLSPVRVIPLCIAASKWPAVKACVAGLASVTDDRPEENYALEDIVQDTEFFILAHAAHTENLPEHDRMFLDALKTGPRRIADLCREFGLPPHAFSAGELERRGFVTRIGMTPTDLLHAEGSYTEYDADTSRIAAGYLARKCGLSLEGFIANAKDRVVRRMTASVMEKMMLDGSGSDELTDAQKEILRMSLDPSRKDYALRFELRKPIVGIGAPVGAWLPKVAEMLNTELLLPPDSEIGNAVGAITGSVSETATVTVRAAGTDMAEEPECDVFTGREIRTFARPQEAMEYARSECARLAREMAKRSGTNNPVVEISVDENVMACSGKTFFRGAVITAKATGKPDLS